LCGVARQCLIEIIILISALIIETFLPGGGVALVRIHGRDVADWEFRVWGNEAEDEAPVPSFRLMKPEPSF
jgi:hypothetical protein